MHQGRNKAGLPMSVKLQATVGLIIANSAESLL